MKLRFIIILLFVASLNVQAGFILITQEDPLGSNPRQIFTPYKLSIKSLQVTTNINENLAETTVEQIFFNPGMLSLEGVYMFPIPKGMMVKNFSMEIDGKPFQAEMLEATKARGIYEDIVRKSLDPALLEYADNGLIRIRVFPILPGSEKKIKLTYSQILIPDNNTMEYIYPLNSKKYSNGQLAKVQVTVNVKNNAEITNLYCPSHFASYLRTDIHNTSVVYSSEKATVENDFRLYVGTSSKNVGMSIVSYKEADEDGFFLLHFSPAIQYAQNKIVAKDIVFVLDISGSMSEEKMMQSQKALTFCLNTLNANDRFEIIKFSTEAEAVFSQLMAANETNISKAKKFVNQMQAMGGTNMDQAFELAFKSKQNSDRPFFVIFITDGKPTIGETNDDKLAEKILAYNISNSRIFTFGIGDEINSYLLDKLTDRTQGYRSYISPTEDIEVKISDFFSKINAPVLTNIELVFSAARGISMVFPKSMPDLFKGGTLSVSGKFKSPGDMKVELKGKVDGQSVSYIYEIILKEDSKNDFVASIWASRHIGYLLDQIRLNGESKEVKDEIIALAKKYGIITPYTSLLILEDEEINISNKTIAQENEIFNGRAAHYQGFMDEQKKEYSKVKKRSGKESVQSSTEIQDLSNSDKIDDSKTGGSRMVYKDINGEEKNFSEQSQMVQGRAIYQKGNQWIDLYVQEKKTKKENKIKFGSKEYFHLLNNDPNVSKFLSLGKNVQFIYKDEMITVYE